MIFINDEYICKEKKKIYLYTSDNSSKRDFSGFIIFLMSLLIKILQIIRLCVSLLRENVETTN